MQNGNSAGRSLVFFLSLVFFTFSSFSLLLFGTNEDDMMDQKTEKKHSIRFSFNFKQDNLSSSTVISIKMYLLCCMAWPLCHTICMCALPLLLLFEYGAFIKIKKHLIVGHMTCQFQSYSFLLFCLS